MHCAFKAAPHQQTEELACKRNAASTCWHIYPSGITRHQPHACMHLGPFKERGEERPLASWLPMRSTQVWQLHARKAPNGAALLATSTTAAAATATATATATAATAATAAEPAATTAHRASSARGTVDMRRPANGRASEPADKSPTTSELGLRAYGIGFRPDAGGKLLGGSSPPPQPETLNNHS